MRLILGITQSIRAHRCAVGSRPGPVWEPSHASAAWACPGLASVGPIRPTNFEFAPSRAWAPGSGVLPAERNHEGKFHHESHSHEPGPPGRGRLGGRRSHGQHPRPRRRATATAFDIEAPPDASRSSRPRPSTTRTGSSSSTATSRSRTQAELRPYYHRMMAQAGRPQVDGLIVNTVGGFDDAWSAAQAPT